MRHYIICKDCNYLTCDKQSMKKHKRSIIHNRNNKNTICTKDDYIKAIELYTNIKYNYILFDLENITNQLIIHC